MKVRASREAPGRRREREGSGALKASKALDDDFVTAGAEEGEAYRGSTLAAAKPQ